MRQVEARRAAPSALVALVGALLASGCATADDRGSSRACCEVDLAGPGGGRGAVDPLPRVEVMRPCCWVPAARVRHSPEIDGVLVGTSDDGVWAAALLQIGF